MYKVYILQSLKNFHTYVGHTSNLEKRLLEHTSGKVTATCNRRPFKILFFETAPSLLIAKQREKYWKNGAGRRKLKKYFTDGFPPS